MIKCMQFFAAVILIFRIGYQDISPALTPYNLCIHLLAVLLIFAPLLNTLTCIAI